MFKKKTLIFGSFILITIILLLLLFLTPTFKQKNEELITFRENIGLFDSIFSGDTNSVALWRFESGALTTDSIGTNTLTDNGGVDSSSDNKEGDYSANFTIADSNFFYITDANLDEGFPLRANDITPIRNISVCFWFKADVREDYDYIFSKYDTGTNKRSFAIHIYQNKIQVAIGKNSDSGVTGGAYLYSTVFQAGQWYHVGVTFQDGASDTSSLRIRIWDDTAGDFLAEDFTTTNASTINVEDSSLYIGDREGDADRLYDGHIDELVVFNDILTTDEIDKIRAGTYGEVVAPNSPTLNSPANETKIEENYVTLNSTSTNVDGENMTIRIYVNNESDFSDLSNKLVYDEYNVTNGSDVTYDFRKYPIYPPQEGLVTYWRFDYSENDGESSNYIKNWAESDPEQIDHLGCTNCGLQNDTVKIFGSSIKFDGADDLMANTDGLNSPNLNFQDEMSVSFWLNRGTTFPQTYAYYIIRQIWNGQVYYGMGLDVDNQDMRFFVYNSTGGVYVVGDGTVPTVSGVWTHIVGTYNSTAMRIYQDGQLKEEIPVSGQILNSDGNLLRIGGGRTSSKSRYASGHMDDVGFWNRSLTAEEVAQMYGSATKNQTYDLFLDFYNTNTTFFYWQVNSTISESNLSNISETRAFNLTGPILDTIYPLFSDYYDNSGELIDSGTGLFNVTLTSTNGTVLLEINNTNYTATNITSSVYNVSVPFTSNGTYPYRWHSWGNGSYRDYNVSGERSFFIYDLEDLLPGEVKKGVDEENVIGYPTQSNLVYDGGSYYAFYYLGNGTYEPLRAKSANSSMIFRAEAEKIITSVPSYMTNITGGYEADVILPFGAYGFYIISSKHEGQNIVGAGYSSTTGVFAQMNGYVDTFNDFNYTPSIVLSYDNFAYNTGIRINSSGDKTVILHRNDNDPYLIYFWLDPEIELANISKNDSLSQAVAYFDETRERNIGAIYSSNNSLYYYNMTDVVLVTEDLYDYRAFRGVTTNNNTLFLTYRNTSGDLVYRLGGMNNVFSNEMQLAIDIDKTGWAYFTTISDLGKRQDNVSIFYYNGTDILRRNYDGIVSNPSIFTSATLTSQFMTAPKHNVDKSGIMYIDNYTLKVGMVNLSGFHNSSSDGVYVGSNIHGAIGFSNHGENIATAYPLGAMAYTGIDQFVYLNIYNFTSNEWKYNWTKLYPYRKPDHHNYATDILRADNENYLYYIVGGRDAYSIHDYYDIFKSTYPFNSSEFNINEWTDISPPQTDYYVGGGYRRIFFDSNNTLYIVNSNSYGSFSLSYYNGTGWGGETNVIDGGFNYFLDIDVVEENGNMSFHIFHISQDLGIDTSTGSSMQGKIDYVKVVRLPNMTFEGYASNGTKMQFPLNTTNRDNAYDSSVGDYYYNIGKAGEIIGTDKPFYVYYARNKTSPLYKIEKLMFVKFNGTGWENGVIEDNLEYDYNERVGCQVEKSDSGNFYVSGILDDGNGVHQIVTYRSDDNLSTWSNPEYRTSGGLTSFAPSLNKLYNDTVILRWMDYASLLNSEAYFTTFSLDIPIITFVSPTDENVIVLRNSTYVNVTISESVSNCSLDFNGTTYWMNNNTDTNWYYNVTDLSDGNYTYNVTCTDLQSNNGTSSTIWTYINTFDDIYPQFSDYWDNNGTLVSSGTGLFNVTLLNTNGTVLLEINNTNYTATNLTSYVYNVSVPFTMNGTYDYRWHSWGNGTSSNYNVSEERSYVVKSDTCTYSSGNWIVNCADNCVISSNVNLNGNNLSITGTGNFTLNANITNYEELYFKGQDTSNICEIRGYNGWFQS